MTRIIQATWILPIILSCASFCLAGLDLTYEWKYIDYVWDSDEQKADAVAAGTYDSHRVIPNDVQPLADGRILVALPRFFNNPASLATISDETGDGGPLLEPYPNWAVHERDDCLGITSVNRLFLDDHNTLWLVDSGKAAGQQLCQPKLLAFDPETDELIYEALIPIELSHYSQDSSLAELEIAAVEFCGDKTYVYISDIDGFGFLIFDGTDIWRLEGDVYFPEADATVFNINGQDLTLNVGPSGVVLTPIEFLKERAMLFKPLASFYGYAVSLEDLHNSKSGSSVTYYRSDLVQPSQELARAYSKSGGILITSFTAGEIACWNLQYPLKEEYIAILDTNVTNLQYVTGVKITQHPCTWSQTVWVLSNEVQQFLLGTINWDVTNFRILTGDLATLVTGTVCDPLSDPLDKSLVANSIADKQFSFYETASDILIGSYPAEIGTRVYPQDFHSNF